jgi:L-alanine-DL-glutamate epimerase-like enolase superfamily enzyme
VAIGEPQTIPAAIAAAEGFERLKIKMGDAGDGERLAAVAAAAGGRPLRVDVNGGWSAEQTVARLGELEAAGVELLEQPVPTEDLEGMARVRAHARLPLVADEPACTAGDLRRLLGRVDAVNVKLAKTGGIRPALRMIHAARALGMRVMLGCMVESSVGIAAAAALSPLTDWTDLDGQRLLADDPASGLELADGRILPPADRPGLGVELSRRVFED